MGRKTTRRPGRRQPDVNRPSTFFLVALAIGLVLLIVIAVVMINRPAQKRGAVQPAAIERAA